MVASAIMANGQTMAVNSTANWSIQMPGSQNKTSYISNTNSYNTMSDWNQNVEYVWYQQECEGGCDISTSEACDASDSLCDYDYVAGSTVVYNVSGEDKGGEEDKNTPDNVAVVLRKQAL